uniref:Uncharacterized protein n=1 Tax=Branchiostoma floridae TaxID=7739 RepID=C3Y096_BRAFL|eukprot:XP_002610159.1 hypothetical protein BRAFLDRAFT_216921 [Branchiostoma floridae]
MAFTFAAFCYIVALLLSACLIFFAIWHVSISDSLDLYTDLNTDLFSQLVLPEYIIHGFFCLLFLLAGEFFSLALNIPLIAYHVYRWEE